MAIFLTSDQHYGHTNVIKYCNRPFEDANHMNEELIRLHNSVVSPEDTVIHLGDFSLNKRAPELILPRLNGIHMMRAIGNHDWCHPTHGKTPVKIEKFRKMYFDAGFQTLELGGAMFVGDTFVEMSHFPYLDPNPEFDQRYPQYRPEDRGNVLLHGHVHQVWQTKISPKGSLMINIGVDVWNMRPVSLETIEQLIKDHNGTRS
jgi:calcineurin-like phosphoesterase family protein